MDCTEFLPLIKNDFGSLWQCRPRGDSIEIITPFSTATQKFITLFITQKHNEFVISEGGWLSSEFYMEEDVLTQTVSENIARYFSDVYKVSTVTHEGRAYYFKKCKEKEMISSLVHDLASFVSSIVNAALTHVDEKKEQDSQTSFRKNVNDYLSLHYKDGIRANKELDGLKNVKYSAIIESRGYLSLIMYVTGSNSYYLGDSIRKAAVNFELAKKSTLNTRIKIKFAVINDEIEKNSFEKVQPLLNHLEEKSTTPPIYWSHKEKIFEAVG